MKALGGLESWGQGLGLHLGESLFCEHGLKGEMQDVQYLPTLFFFLFPLGLEAKGLSWAFWESCREAFDVRRQFRTDFLSL